MDFSWILNQINALDISADECVELQRAISRLLKKKHLIYWRRLFITQYGLKGIAQDCFVQLMNKVFSVDLQQTERLVRWEFRLEPHEKNIILRFVMDVETHKVHTIWYEYPGVIGCSFKPNGRNDIINHQNNHVDTERVNSDVFLIEKIAIFLYESFGCN